MASLVTMILATRRRTKTKAAATKSTTRTTRHITSTDDQPTNGQGLGQGLLHDVAGQRELEVELRSVQRDTEPVGFD